LTGTGTTYAHQLALGGLYTSAVTHFGFSPEQIASVEAATPAAIEYLRALPAVWDETRVLPESKIGELAVMARRTGDAWFLVGINGTSAPLALNDIDLSFLGSDAYRAVVLRDATQFSLTTQLFPLVTANLDFDVFMLGGGGFVAQFTPASADFDFDNDADGADFLLWQRGLSKTGAAAHDGDANGDGVVNAVDLGIWKGQFGVFPASAAGATIPEPAAAALAALGSAMSLAANRRRRRAATVAA
jgi:hypothetical protein